MKNTLRKSLINKINRALIIFISAFALIFAPTGNILNLIITFSVPIVLCLPKIFKALTGLKTDSCFELVYISYVFLAQVLSLCFGLYSVTSFYDKAMHLLSGVLSAAFALVLLRSFSLENTKNGFKAIFFIAVTLMIAALWEFFEFFGDSFFHRNAQRIQTGVGDTMFDMLCAFTGGGIYSLFYFIIRNFKFKRQ